MTLLLTALVLAVMAAQVRGDVVTDLESVDPSTERPLWIISARQGDELRLAFYDGVNRRPEDFGPRHKLVVLTLVAARVGSAPAAPDPCGILRAADVDRLVGGATRARPTQRGGSPGSSCALDRTDGSRSVFLTLIAPPAGPAYVDAARQEAQGWTVVVVAHRHGTAMILKFETLGTDRVEMRRFASRVLDAL